MQTPALTYFDLPPAFGSRFGMEVYMSFVSATQFAFETLFGALKRVNKHLDDVFSACAFFPNQAESQQPTNPVSGLPMLGASRFDLSGNPYGTDDSSRI